jgi:hypothetical protein
LSESTPAHCVKSYEGKVRKPNDTYVLLGDHSLKDDYDGQEYFNLSKIIIHPDFKWLSVGHFVNDIALLKLARPTKINAKIGKVCLPVSTGT